MSKRAWMAAACVLLMSSEASALNYEWEGVNFTLNNRLTSGVGVRMQDRSTDLLGKTNVPGQQDLCSRDTCTSLTGDPEPNQRLVDAPGAFAGVNADNGNLNYDQYDLISAQTRFSSDLTVTYGEWLARIRAIAFYDPVNADFEEKHTDTRFQGPESPRSKTVEDIYAKGVDLYDAYVQRTFQFNDRDGVVSLGFQTVRWGESTLIARNAIAEINAPSSIVLHTPGFEINEVFRPVAALVVSGGLTDSLSAEFYYQLQWRKIQPDPAGSFFADLDLLESDMAIVSLGQLGEDPLKQQRIKGPISVISSTSGTIFLGSPHEPRDRGQYGLRLNYYADWLSHGTELSFYFLNYHSRYPYATAVATDASCTHGVGPNGTLTNDQEASGSTSLLRCRGFNGSLLGRSDEHDPEREPLPIDTLGAYLEYPEDIQMYGLSFNTTVGEFSLAGEYSFRPNLPLQISINDVIFAALQPAFPANDFLVDPTGLLNALSPFIDDLTPELLADLQQLGSARFPGRDTALPSFVRHYRGIDVVQPHQVIPGYERFAVGQVSLTAIKAFSINPFGADQILWISEAGFTQVYDFPDRSVLQLEGGSPNATHASMGQDEKGPNDFATLNPHRQTEGFGDAFAWGLRTIIQAEYNDVLFGWALKPQIIGQWDIKGTAPFPIQNFVEGRRQFDIGGTVNVTESFSVRANYQIFTGGGRHNVYRDRDNLSLTAAYAF